MREKKIDTEYESEQEEKLLTAKTDNHSIPSNVDDGIFLACEDVWGGGGLDDSFSACAFFLNFLFFFCCKGGNQLAYTSSNFRPGSVHSGSAS